MKYMKMKDFCKSYGAKECGFLIYDFDIKSIEMVAPIYEYSDKDYKLENEYPLYTMSIIHDNFCTKKRKIDTFKDNRYSKHILDKYELNSDIAIFEKSDIDKLIDTLQKLRRNEL